MGFYLGLFYGWIILLNLPCKHKLVQGHNLGQNYAENLLLHVDVHEI